MEALFCQNGLVVSICLIALGALQNTLALKVNGSAIKINTLKFT